MKSSDPIPKEWQGVIFGSYLFLIIPGLSLYWLIAGKVDISWAWAGLALGVWYLQMVGVLVGYHRYFSHKSFKTGRVVQFILGLLGCISGQKGPIFWSSQHRHHHSHCEEEEDAHTPYRYGDLKGIKLFRGFAWSHFWNLVQLGPPDIEDKYVRDLVKQKDLVFLEKASTLIYYGFGAAMFAGLGLNGLLWGFLLPSFLSWNCVMLVNSAVHIWGARPWVSKIAPECNARNIWWLSLPMLGDNWHNNHHADMNSARSGFYWYQVDLNWYLIWLLGKLGLVWDIRHPDWKMLESFDAWEARKKQGSAAVAANPSSAVPAPSSKD